ncbi:MAG: methyltransferase domain-containing protein [Planctomycetota bacterium]
MHTAGELAPLRQRDGRYRGIPLHLHRVTIATDVFDITALKDAAALLDDAEFVRECEKTDRLPYGFEIWPASLMLAEHLYRNEPGQGRRAIELGCGVGLVSIVAARTGWHILATDCDPVALQFAEFNAAANAVEMEAFQLLDWHDPPTGPRFSRVLAADVLYQRCDHAPILKCIDQLLEHEGMAIIADPNRGVADDFVPRAEANGFCVEVIPTAASLDDPAPVAGRLFILRRP